MRKVVAEIADKQWCHLPLVPDLKFVGVRRQPDPGANF
jgi:hypothetical protein